MINVVNCKHLYQILKYYYLQIKRDPNITLKYIAWILSGFCSGQVDSPKLKNSIRQACKMNLAVIHYILMVSNCVWAKIKAWGIFSILHAFISGSEGVGNFWAFQLPQELVQDWFNIFLYLFFLDNQANVIQNHGNYFQYKTKEP